MPGRVHQLNIGDGGIPKRAVEMLRITTLGPIGDDHANAIHHGGPNKAICIYSLEEYQALGEDGVRVLGPATLQQNLRFRNRMGDAPRPGDFGENITTVGINYAELKIGNRLDIGNEVTIELTMTRTPCSTLSEAFGEQVLRMIHGRSGFKAKVVSVGSIKRGDGITVRSGRWENGELRFVDAPLL